MVLTPGVAKWGTRLTRAIAMMTEDEAQDAWMSAGGNDRDEMAWGMFSYLDIPPAFCGSGTGGFTWFPTRDELLDFLQTVVPASTRMDDEDKEKALEAFKAKLAAAPEDLEGFRSVVNDELGGHIQVDWMGTLEDLRTGDHPYAIYLRARFHTDHDEDFDKPFDRKGPVRILRKYGTAIESDEKEDFDEFISVWGA